MKHGAGGEINRVDSIDGRYKNKLADKHSNNVKTRAKIEYKAWKLEELKMQQALLETKKVIIPAGVA
jgi:hypothetical protein